MKLNEYPPQEPLSAAGAAYNEDVMRGFPAADALASIEIPYGADPYQRMILFPAAKPNGTVLLAFHGGGWTSGYKEWMGFMAPAFVAAGVTFVTAGYRLAPSHLFPTGFDDCCAALSASLPLVAEHGGDPQRVFLSGHSAGGHYAALMAVRRDWQARAGVPADVVLGCLPLSGVYHFGEGSGLTMRPRFLGADTDADAAQIARQASPILNIVGVPPPFLMSCGTQDFPHLVTQADAMQAALRAAGGEAELIRLEGMNHFQAHLASADPQGAWLPVALEWLQRH